MLLRLTKVKNRRVQLVPKCLPFNTIESLMQFDNASDEIYNEVVSTFWLMISILCTLKI